MPAPAPAPPATRKTKPRSSGSRPQKGDGGNGSGAPPGTPRFLTSPEEALRDGERRGREDASTEQSQWSDAADFEEDTRTCLEGEEPPGPLAEDASTLACEARDDAGGAPISSEEPSVPEASPDVSVDDSTAYGPLADADVPADGGAPTGEEGIPPEVEGGEPIGEGDTTGGEGEGTGGGPESDGAGGAGGGGPAGRPAAAEAPDLAGMESMAGGDLDLIDAELAEHQRWAGALGQVGTAGSSDRLKFALKQITEGFGTGLAGGAGMGLSLGLLHRGLNSQFAARAVAPLAARMGGSALAGTGAASAAAAKMAGRLGAKLGPKVAAQCAKFTPLPAIGAVIGGVISFHALYTRPWAQTAETISKFGEGEKYEFLANSIAAISEIVDVLSNGLNVIAGLMGAITLGLWVGAVLTAGALSPLAGTLTALSLAIGAVTLALDAINMIVLQPSVTLFRALHTFTSEADPREIVANGQELSAAAAANGGALGGLAGAHAANLGGAKPNPKAPESTKHGDDTPPPAGGDGARVEFEGQAKPPELPAPPAAAEGGAPASGAPPHPAETPAAAPPSPPEGAPPVTPTPEPRPAIPPPGGPDVPIPDIPKPPPLPHVPVQVPPGPVPGVKPLGPTEHPPVNPYAPTEAPAPPSKPAPAPEPGAPPPAAPEVPAAAPPSKPAKPTKAAPPPGAPPAPSPDHTWVPGYTKKDGTVVGGYWRGPSGSPAPKPAKPKAAPPPGAPPAPSPDHTWVPAYTKKDGTVVSGYWKGPPGSPKPAKPKAAPPPGAPPAPSPDHTWVPAYTKKDGTAVAGYWKGPPGSPKPPKPPKPPKAPPPSGGPPLTPAQIADEVARAGRRARQGSIRREGRKNWERNLRESVESGIYDPQSAKTVEDLGPGRVDDILSPKVKGEPHPGSRAESIKQSIEFSDLPRLADQPLEPKSGGKSYGTSFEEHREGHHEGNTKLPIELGEPRRPDWDVTNEPAREFTSDPDKALSSALDPDAPMESGFEKSKGWQTSELDLPTDIFNDPSLANHPNPRIRKAYAEFKAKQSGGGGTPPATPAPAPEGTTPAAAEPASIPPEAIPPEPVPPQGPPEPDVPPPPPAGGPEPGPESPPPAPTPPPDVTPETPPAPETPSTPTTPETPSPTPPETEAGPAPPEAGPPAPRVPAEEVRATVTPDYKPGEEPVSRTASTGEIATHAATAAESGRAPPDKSPSLTRLFFPIFYAGEHGPSPEEQQAAFNAQFTADFPPVQGVERANPAYPEPPCTPAQIEAIRGHIAQLRQARAQATNAEAQMDEQIATHTANEGPLAETVATTEAGIDATEQHSEKTQCTADANDAQQERQTEVGENVSHYAEHESAIDGLRTPTRAFQGMMDLASYLPGDAGEAMQSMNNDATQMLAAFDEMDASMAAQETDGAACTAKLEDDASQIESTSTEADATLEQLTTAQTDATTLEEQNTCAVDEATENKSAAESAGGEIDSQIDEQEDKAETLAQQLQSWAEAHRAARMAAVDATKAKVEKNDQKVTAVHTE